MGLSLEPIGVIHSPFAEQAGTPIQPAYAKDSLGEVELYPAYIEALADLAGFERIWLLYQFDRAAGWRPLVVPYRDDQPRGLFATRAPARPCPIGLSVVELIAVSGARLHIRGVDVLDGTPLLDIKPYVPDFDSHPDSRAGWLDQTGPAREQADDRFGE
jgi:tRNA-Thr(GGU) m(6)t(6)A37 methyltransferase TsaA